MKRPVVVAICILWPASAAADVTSSPIGPLTYDGWLIFGSVTLGIIFAGLIWKSRSDREDAD